MQKTYRANVVKYSNNSSVSALVFKSTNQGMGIASGHALVLVWKEAPKLLLSALKMPRYHSKRISSLVQAFRIVTLRNRK